MTQLTARTAPVVVMFVYLTIARTWGISDTFWLLGDQIRDWRLALLPFSELPLTGAPSSVGGVGLGPIYYWTLWVCRVVIGPWVDNMPTRAASASRCSNQPRTAYCLLESGRRPVQASWRLRFTLVVATAPIDMALTATIWNPPLSVALVKLTLALLLFAPNRPSLGWAVATTATGWLAVQAHSTAIFIAAPAIGAFVMLEVTARNWKAALQRARASIGVVLLLQGPFFLQPRPWHVSRTFRSDRSDRTGVVSDCRTGNDQGRRRVRGDRVCDGFHSASTVAHRGDVRRAVRRPRARRLSLPP